MKYHCLLMGSVACASLILSSGCHRSTYSERIINEKYIHTYGVEIEPEDWSCRGKNGQVVSTLASGVTVNSNFSGGVLHGEKTYTFPDSTSIEKVETYSQGNLVKEMTYYRSGAPYQEITYSSPSTKNVKVWYDHGAPKCVEMYQGNQLVHADYFNLNGDSESKVENGQGTRILRDSFGQLSNVDTFQCGHMSSRVSYYPNGHPKEMIPYQLGQIDGERKTFFPGGEPNTVEQWSGGKPHGNTVFFQNGDKCREVPYVNGMKEGVEKRYRDGTEVAEEITWSADRKHGPHTFYADGNQQTDWYYLGKPVNKITYDQYSRARGNQ